MRPLEDDVDRALLLRALSRLPPRERQIISMRFGIDLPEAMTQKEVADRLGISQSYISRLEKRIIAKNAPGYRLADLMNILKQVYFQQPRGSAHKKRLPRKRMSP